MKKVESFKYVTMPFSMYEALLAVDPGNQTGYAVFLPFRLTDAVRTPGDAWYLAHCGLGFPDASPRRFVIEMPQIYPRTPVPPNDIVKLAFQAGMYAGRMGNAEYVTPHEWKGNLPKELCGRRTLGKLSPEEREVYEKCVKGVAAGYRHNVQDAIGIGLFVLGRQG